MNTDVTGNEVVAGPYISGYRCQICRLIRPFWMRICPCQRKEAK